MEQWKKLEETYTYRGWRQMMRRRFLLPNGRTADFDILGARPYVTVAALTSGGEFLLTRQYRPGPEKVLLSFAEGGIDPHEEPEAAARRELLEETGYTAGEIKLLRKFRSSYTDQIQYSMLATRCDRIREQALDPNEFIELLKISPANLRALLRDTTNESFTNAGTAYMALDALGML